MQVKLTITVDYEDDSILAEEEVVYALERVVEHLTNRGHFTPNDEIVENYDSDVEITIPKEE